MKTNLTWPFLQVGRCQDFGTLSGKYAMPDFGVKLWAVEWLNLIFLGWGECFKSLVSFWGCSLFRGYELIVGKQYIHWKVIDFWWKSKLILESLILRRGSLYPPHKVERTGRHQVKGFNIFSCVLLRGKQTHINLHTYTYDVGHLFMFPFIVMEIVRIGPLRRCYGPPSFETGETLPGSTKRTTLNDLWVFNPHTAGGPSYLEGGRETWKLEVVGRWGCGWEWMCFRKKLDSMIFKVEGENACQAIFSWTWEGFSWMDIGSEGYPLVN